MSETIVTKSLVHGIGIYKKGKYCSKVNRKHTKAYSVWKSMLLRCYSESYQAKYPTYLGCHVSENFKNFQYFAEWCQSQVGFGFKDYHLDKDILSGSSKVYSENTCAFIPLRLNLVLQTKPSLVKELPLGVVFCKNTGKYLSRCTFDGKCKSLGYFNTPEDASVAYQKAKQDYVREMAEHYKEVIDSRIYLFFKNFTVV